MNAKCILSSISKHSLVSVEESSFAPSESSGVESGLLTSERFLQSTTQHCLPVAKDSRSAEAGTEAGVESGAESSVEALGETSRHVQKPCLIYPL